MTLLRAIISGAKGDIDVDTLEERDVDVEDDGRVRVTGVTGDMISGVRLGDSEEERGSGRSRQMNWMSPVSRIKISTYIWWSKRASRTRIIQRSF